MRNIRLVPPKRTIQPSMVDTPLQTALTMALGCVLVVTPWLGAVWLHYLVTH